MYPPAAAAPFVPTRPCGPAAVPHPREAPGGGGVPLPLIWLIALACLALPASAAARARTPNLAWLEFESILPVRDRDSAENPSAPGGVMKAVPVTWVMAYPDTLASTDTRAILSSLEAGKGQPLLPKGRLSAVEEDFLEGLRAFMDNSPQRTAEAWSRLQGRALPPALAASMRINLAVLLALRDDAATAERAWVAEWRHNTPAAEGAWRNLLTVRMAQGRWREAGEAIDAMLARQPRNRLAVLAQAALMRQLRPEPEWAAFLKARADEDSAVPDMQLAYGEYLLERGHPRDLATAVLYFDKGLEKQPQSGRGWFLLAEAQFRQGYYYFALDCLQNAGRAGYAQPDFYVLFARVLHTCCTGDEDPRAKNARAAAQDLLEKGLVKDLHRRSAAQLLYTLYAQNLNPGAAAQITRSLWFHFEGPRRDIRPLGDHLFGPRAVRGLDAQALRVKFGLYDLDWILALRKSDVYRAF
jgi:hypothetical protein